MDARRSAKKLLLIDNILLTLQKLAISRFRNLTTKREFPSENFKKKTVILRLKLLFNLLDSAFYLAVFLIEITAAPANTSALPIV